MCAEDESFRRIVQYATDKMVTGFQFTGKLPGRINGRINFPPESLFSLAKCGDEIGNPDLANYHEVYVTLRRFFASRDRSVDKRTLNLVAKRFECRSQDVFAAHEFSEETGQLRQIRAGRICSKVGLPTFHAALEDSSVG
jgi:hypothetical protein